MGAIRDRWKGREADPDEEEEARQRAKTLEGQLYSTPGKVAGSLAPSSPYEKAAYAAEQAAQQFGQFSDQQWQRQLGGLNLAQFYAGPASDYAQNQARDSQPGFMEQAFGNNQYRYNQPTASGGLYNQLHGDLSKPGYLQEQLGRFSGQLNAPQQLQGMYGQMQSQLGGPGAAQSLYGNTQFGPTQSQQQWNATRGTYGQQGALEGFSNNLASQLGGPNRMSQLADQNLYGQQGRAEGFRAQNVGNARDYNAQMNARMAQPSAIDRGAGEIGSYLRSASDVSDFASRNLGQLEQGGMYEQFAQSALNGTNPALQRAKQNTVDTINQQMALRGHFNSGAAVDRISEGLSSLEAANFEKLAGIAQGGQQAQMQRIGAGQSLAESSGTAKMGQAGGLQRLAEGRDVETGRREDSMARGAQMSSSENLASQQLGLSAAQAADQSRFARLAGMQSQAQGADQGRLDSLRLQGDIYGQSQAAQLARLQAGQSAAGQTDDAGMRQLAQQFAMSQGADQSQLARLGSLRDTAGQLDHGGLERIRAEIALTQGADQSQMARYGMLGNLAGQYDSADLAQLNSLMSGASNAQTAQRGRAADNFDALLRAGALQSGLVGGFYGMGGQLSGQAKEASLNAQANAGQLRAQGQAAGQDFFWNLLSTGLSAGGGGGRFGGGGF